MQLDYDPDRRASGIGIAGVLAIAFCAVAWAGLGVGAVVLVLGSHGMGLPFDVGVVGAFIFGLTSIFFCIVSGKRRMGNVVNELVAFAAITGVLVSMLLPAFFH